MFDVDFTIVSYTIMRCVLVYNFALFFVWAVLAYRESGYVSDIYKLVMMLFVARFYGVAIGTHARYLREDYEAYRAFMTGWVWDSRLVPETTIFIILAIILTRRFVKSYWFSDPEYKRKRGRRKADRNGA